MSALHQRPAAGLAWANSSWRDAYEALWHSELTLRAGPFALTHDLREWVNDALMVVFFFVVGLEVKREFVEGELSEPARDHHRRTAQTTGRRV